MPGVFTLGFYYLITKSRYMDRRLVFMMVMGLVITCIGYSLGDMGVMFFGVFIVCGALLVGIMGDLE